MADFEWRIVIHESRYSGVYEGGRWFALFIGDKFPDASIGGDVECATFFGRMEGIVGIGNSPDEALFSLLAKNKTAYKHYEKFLNYSGRPAKQQRLLRLGKLKEKFNLLIGR